MTSDDGGDEAVRYSAARLLAAVEVGIHLARNQLHEWRAERLTKALPNAAWWSGTWEGAVLADRAWTTSCRWSRSVFDRDQL